MEWRPVEFGYVHGGDSPTSSLRWRYSRWNLTPIGVAVGAMRHRLPLLLLETLEMHLYRRAVAIIALTEGIRADLVSRGIAKDKVAVVMNGADLARYAPRPRSTPPKSGMAAPAARTLSVAADQAPDLCPGNTRRLPGTRVRFVCSPAAAPDNATTCGAGPSCNRRAATQSPPNRCPPAQLQELALAAADRRR